MTTSDPDHLDQKRKIRKVFEFVREWHERNVEPTTQWTRTPWHLSLTGLPTYPTVRSHLTVEDEQPQFVLRVERPKETPCPLPPEELGRWLLSGWKEPTQDARVLEKINEVVEEDTITIRFDEDPERVQAFEAWKSKRDEWREAEKPARHAMGLYDRLFELRSRLQREGESFVLVLGDAMVRARGTSGEVLHPMLLQRAELVFDETVPCFTVSLADDAPELHSESLRTLQNVNTAFLSELRDEVRSGTLDLLSGSEVRTQMRKVLNTLLASVEYFEEPAPLAEDDRVRAWRQPVLMLAQRTARVADAIEKTIERIESAEHPPAPLVGIVRQKTDRPYSPAADLSFGGSGSGRSKGTRPKSRSETRRALLLSKPANEAQERILTQIEKQDTVVVQGPPGTGKTHTIANMLGHFLAQGKRVLVVSHSSKALRVLRGQLPEPLQPLCVSLLDSDKESRDELEQSVRGIMSRIASGEAYDLDDRRTSLQRERDRLIDELESRENELREAIADEYRDVVVAGKSFDPSEAAKLIASAGEAGKWIPGDMAAGQACPLSPQEVHELYRLNTELRRDQEDGLSGTLPRLDDLPSPEILRETLERRTRLTGKDLNLPEELWNAEATDDRDELLEAWQAFVKAFQRVVDMRKKPYLLECMDAGWRGGARLEPGLAFVDLLRARAAEVDACYGKARTGGAVVASELRNEEGLKTCSEMREAIGRGGTVYKGAFRLQAKVRPSWKRLLESATVAGRPPQTEDDFAAVEASIRVAVLRDELARRWRAHFDEYPEQRDTNLGDQPEDTVRQHAETIEDALRWFDAFGRGALEGLERVGLKVDACKRLVDPRTGRFAEFEHLLEAADRVMRKETKRRLDSLELVELYARMDDWSDRLRAIPTESDKSGLAGAMADAIVAGDADAYAQAHGYLTELHRQREAYERRSALIHRLRPSAGPWAEAIAIRLEPHQGPQPPGDPTQAWTVCQLAQELDRRSATDASALQARVAELRKQLQEKTAELAEAMAWGHQSKRVGPTQRRALESWYAAVAAKGYETGKRSAALKAQARRDLEEARDAVPAWVMTTRRAVESLDFGGPSFDVVIFDEASQVNMMGLLPLSLTRKAIVVGDDKQVTPDSVGENLDETQKLIDEHLQEIPSKQHFTGRFSLYHFAKQSFEQHHMLTEHFRCAEDIIDFSNTLSYDGKIRPLRDMSQVERVPPLVEHPLRGSFLRKTNEEEAEEVAALLIACLDQPEYQGATFGVISMLGDEQADLIDTHLHRHLSDRSYEKARVLCGKPSQFQGDERDVVFLSLVHSSGSGPLRSRKDDDTQKRYNVAASRAKDQLWVVHSIGDNDLTNEEDLRLRLLRHVRDPSAAGKQARKIERKADSPFEVAVGRALTDRGYRVESQWPVGSLKIDLVAVGADNAKVAIECDGEKHHPPEQQEKDLERQQVLERLGWRFIRIRGSAYYREPESTIAGVAKRLSELGVEPIGASDENAAERQGDELVERVRRRAAELRAEWLADEEGQDQDGDGELATPVGSPVDLTHVVMQGNTSTVGGTANDDPEAAILDCVRQATRPMSRRDIVSRTGLDPMLWQRAIGSLVSSGRLERIGETGGSRYVMPSAQDGLDQSHLFDAGQES